MWVLSSISQMVYEYTFVTFYWDITFCFVAGDCGCWTAALVWNLLRISEEMHPFDQLVSKPLWLGWHKSPQVNNFCFFTYLLLQSAIQHGRSRRCTLVTSWSDSLCDLDEISLSKSFASGKPLRPWVVAFSLCLQFSTTLVDFDITDFCGVNSI